MRPFSFRSIFIFIFPLLFYHKFKEKSSFTRIFEWEFAPTTSVLYGVIFCARPSMFAQGLVSNLDRAGNFEGKKI